jgi:hypothetical protein
VRLRVAPSSLAAFRSEGIGVAGDRRFGDAGKIES